MDLLCPLCGEPWDNDELHHVAGKTYRQALHDFQARGCLALGSRHSAPANITAARAAAALYDILGDDADGAAAMLEDYGLT